MLLLSSMRASKYWDINLSAQLCLVLPKRDNGRCTTEEGQIESQTSKESNARLGGRLGVTIYSNKLRCSLQCKPVVAPESALTENFL